MAAIGEKPFPTSTDLPRGESNYLNKDSGSTPSAMAANGTATATADTGSGGNMLGRVVQGAHQTLDRLADTAAPHVQRLQEGLDVGTEQVKEIGDQWAQSLRCSVRENPLTAVATAMAVGVLVARLMQR
jgi:ElaB/YqjD/DUF883 family membrane-anchored ribosome-binding protein